MVMLYFGVTKSMKSCLGWPTLSDLICQKCQNSSKTTYIYFQLRNAATLCSAAWLRIPPLPEIYRKHP